MGVGENRNYGKNKYLLTMMMAKRANQLIAGAKPFNRN